MTDFSIPFIDLKAQQALIRDKVEAAIARVLDHGAYIMGPEVAEFERQLACFAGAKHVISCANGTDALHLVLMCEEVGPGDAVFVPSFTFVATGEAPLLVGATPVFVDVCEDSYNMDPESLKLAIVSAKKAGLIPKVVIPVDLFGQPADYPALNIIAKENNMVVVADAAQGFGGSLHGKRVGTLGDYTTTSFFPAKPLGCYGDGGAILTDDVNKAEVLKSIRIHGQGADKYDNVRLGVNSRLDSFQAAVLIEKLAIFDDELKSRDQIARRYNAGLKGHVGIPELIAGGFSAWAQYTVRVNEREQVVERLKEMGVPTAIYYPRPLHMQAPYRSCPLPTGRLPVTEFLASEVLSLPMHPYLDEERQNRIIACMRAAVA
ncbi:DegT/DnrJ/EryC1/StrS family aminotransferase [Kiloniella sp.]|uniref:DegT/DnrJ/EryC1/StrS family aminotransferase n=1 Tax=Kiloniella sp. TaxID=1938587 RepID=UPI003A92300B